MSLNSVNVMGNLTRDPELKSLPSGKTVCVMSIANNRVYSKAGERTTEVSYFDVDVWGPAAENCAKYLKRGSGIVVGGRLKQDRWEKDGKTQSKVRIVANSVHFLARKSEDGAGAGARQTKDDVNSNLDAAAELDPESVAWGE